MAICSIFAVTDAAHVNQLEQLNDRFLNLYNPNPLGPWGLEHRLLRAADAPTTSDSKTQPRYLEILTLLHRPGKAFVAIDGPSAVEKPNGAGEKAVKIGDSVIAIPAQQRDEFYRMIVNKMAALWTPRMMLGIQNGMAYDIGEYIVRMGELKQVTAQNTTRALIVCIQSNAGPGQETKLTQRPDADTGAKEEQEWQLRKEEVQKFWKTFGIEGAREAYYVSKLGDDEFEEIRLWCDVLRLRP
jgi:hypothetical protein